MRRLVGQDVSVNDLNEILDEVSGLESEVSKLKFAVVTDNLDVNSTITLFSSVHDRLNSLEALYRRIKGAE